jgi:hypothetical protein
MHVGLFLTVREFKRVNRIRPPEQGDMRNKAPDLKEDSQEKSGWMLDLRQKGSKTYRQIRSKIRPSVGARQSWEADLLQRGLVELELATKHSRLVINRPVGRENRGGQHWEG